MPTGSYNAELVKTIESCNEGEDAVTVPDAIAGVATRAADTGKRSSRTTTEGFMRGLAEAKF